MEPNLKKFLEKFAELERRVRKLAAEDRALRQEVLSLREKVRAAEAESEMLRQTLAREQRTRIQARDRVNHLIARLDDLHGVSSGPGAGKPASEAIEVEP